MTFVVKDHFFKKAKKENFLARSVYKLEEIQKKFKILRPGFHVIDLGYFPGSWVQLASKEVGSKGQVWGFDLQDGVTPVRELDNVRLFCLDIFQLTKKEQISLENPVDVILSDMAPHTTGIRSVDQDRSLNLVEKVFELIPEFLRPNGNLVIKVFESAKAQEFLKAQRSLFKEFHYLRPKSTRSVSKEFFVIGKEFKSKP